jgi:TetR/AcrR family transcriptional regulator
MATDLEAVRWGDGRRADSDFAREQILDAAWRCYKNNTFQKTRMEHIAREAKVSRTTIYRYFQNRDEVLAGVVLRALHDMIDQVRGRIAEPTSFDEFLVESLVSIAEEVPHSPVFSVLMLEETIIMSRMYIGSSPIFAIMSTYFKPRFEAARAAGELRDGVEFEQFMNWIIHVLSGYVLAVSPLRGSNEWREILRRFLAPSILREEAISPPKR